MSPGLDAETRHALRDKRSRRRWAMFWAGSTLFVLAAPLPTLVILYVGIVAVDANYTTAFAPGYSWWGFRSVSVGDSVESVRERIGEPIKVSYQPHRFRYEYDHLNLVVTFESFWTVHEVYDPRGHLPYPLPQYTRAKNIEDSLGEPTRKVNEGNTEWWWYSKTTDPGMGNHWIRKLNIDLESQKVIKIKSSLYFD